MYFVHTSIGLLRQCYLRQVVSSGALKIRLRKGPYYLSFWLTSYQQGTESLQQYLCG